MFILLNILWLFRTSKYVLFWVYLWQLKEYHIQRFLDHFKTYKGKQIILNPVSNFKIVLFLFVLIFPGMFSVWFFTLFLIYLAESALFAKNIWQNSYKKPVKTFKTLFLIALGFFTTVIFLILVSLNLEDPGVLLWILGFDIFLPVLISIIVLMFQPVFVFARNRTLQKARQKISLMNNLRVIAITGSYGKTTTKEFLTVILSKKFKVISTKEHQNSEIGIANCILNNLTPQHQIFVAEVGAYNKGKVKEVCSIIKPKIGVVTGVNEQHLALFGSMENLLSAEGGRELAEALPKDGILAVNGENKYCLDLLIKSNNLSPDQEKIYALSNKSSNADIWAEDITVKKNELSFMVINKAKEMASFRINVLGKQNIQNLLGAILIARELGMSLEEISEACKNIKSEQSGMVLKQGKLGLDIIDSSYSSNPDGVFADLEYLKIFPNKKIIVMPCLIELGEKSSEVHKKIGKKIGQVCDLAIITTKDKFKEIKTGAMSEGMQEKNIMFLDNPQEIYSAITLFARHGDAVLLEGRVPQKVIQLLTEKVA